MYCVKDKRKTENAPNSESVIIAKNGRKMMKSTCAVCGTKKFRILPNSYNGPAQGAGIMDFIANNPALVNAGLEMIKGVRVRPGAKTFNN